MAKHPQSLSTNLGHSPLTHDYGWRGRQYSENVDKNGQAIQGLHLNVLIENWEEILLDFGAPNFQSLKVSLKNPKKNQKNSCKSS